MMKNPDEVFASVKTKVIAFFEKEIPKQALEHTTSRIERIFKNAIDNSALTTFEKLEIDLNEFWGKQNFKNVYTEIETSFQELVKNKDYQGILKVFNNKGLFANSQVATFCDLNTKNDAYLNYIIGILKENNKNSKTIRKAIMKKVDK